MLNQKNKGEEMKQAGIVVVKAFKDQLEGVPNYETPVVVSATHNLEHRHQQLRSQYPAPEFVCLPFKAFTYGHARRLQKQFRGL